MQPPVKVMLSIKLNPNWAARFRHAGMKFVVRTHEVQAQIIKQHEQEAANLGRDAYRANRIDSTNHRQPDSGTPVFTWDKAGKFAINPRSLPAELLSALGMYPISAALVQKPGDRMVMLRITFAFAAEEERDGFQFGDEMCELFNTILNRPYEHGHVFRNPDGGMTINLAHALVEERKPAEERLLPIGGLTSGCQNVVGQKNSKSRPYLFSGAVPLDSHDLPDQGFLLKLKIYFPVSRLFELHRY